MVRGSAILVGQAAGEGDQGASALFETIGQGVGAVLAGSARWCVRSDVVVFVMRENLAGRAAGAASPDRVIFAGEVPKWPVRAIRATEVNAEPRRLGHRADRDDTSSFERVFATCRCTVCSLMYSFSAMAWLLKPFEMSRSTSTSRAVRPLVSRAAAPDTAG